MCTFSYGTCMGLKFLGNENEKSNIKCGTCMHCEIYLENCKLFVKLNIKSQKRINIIRKTQGQSNVPNKINVC